MRVKLTGINTVRRRLADGTIHTHYYHRATGTKLQGEPGSAEFLASHQDAGRVAALKRSQGTVEWLIRQYQASRAWTKKLSEKTRANEEFNVRACEAKWGKTHLKIVENPRSRPGFLKWHEQLAEDHPRAADAKLARLAKVFAWGVDHGHIRHNPIATFERAYSSARAEIIWLPEHVQAFEAVARPEIRLAMMLALHTGQRQGDILKLEWAAWNGAAITLKQGKSKRTVYVPATRALKAALDAAPRRADTILVAARGGPWLKRRFHEVWSETFMAAGIADKLHFHDLRGTAVTMLAEAGCSVPEIATITGHSPAHAQKILDQYLARTRSLAESAIAKLDEHARNREKADRSANDAANGDEGDALDTS